MSFGAGVTYARPVTGRIAMNAHHSAASHSISRFVSAGFLLALTAAPTIGCGSVKQPDHSLRADLAAIHSAHDDADAIGSLDATAPPPDLNQYRRPTYRAASAR
jgi:hypothetical protein